VVTADDPRQKRTAPTPELRTVFYRVGVGVFGEPGRRQAPRDGLDRMVRGWRCVEIGQQ